MASITPYPSGSDILAPLPLYSPDFGTMSSLLDKRSALYEQGFNRVKSVESLIQNALDPNTSDPRNLKMRDQFIQQAKDQLKNISRTDLSQLQNVQAAESVFAPIWEDKMFMMDAAAHKNAQAQIQTALSYRDSSDEKKRALYSDTAVQHIYNGLKPLKTANGNMDAYSELQNNRFIPTYDISGELEKLRKDAGYELVYTDASGPQIVKTTNGVKSYETYANFVQANWKPQYNDQIRMQASVANERAIDEYMSMGMSKSEAKRAIAESFAASSAKSIDGLVSQNNSFIESLKGQLKDVMGMQKDPNSQDGQKIVAMAEEITNKIKYYEGVTSDQLKTKENYVKGKDPSKYEATINSIVGKGTSYFADMLKNKKIHDLATSMAGNQKVEVTTNTAFFEQQNYNLNLKKTDLEIAKYNTTLDVMSGKYPFTETGKRVGASEGGGGSDAGGGEGGGGSSEEDLNAKATRALAKPRVRGVNVFNQQVDGSMFETFENFSNSHLSQAYNGIKTAIERSDLLGKDISPAMLTALMEVLPGSTVTDNTEYKDGEWKRLKEKGIIPQDADYDYRTGKGRGLNAIADYLTKKIIAKGDNRTESENQVLLEIARAKEPLTTWHNLQQQKNKLVNNALSKPDFAEIREGKPGEYTPLSSESLTAKFNKAGVVLIGKTPLSNEQFAKAITSGKVGEIVEHRLPGTTGGGITNYIVKVNGTDFDISAKDASILTSIKPASIAQKMKLAAEAMVPNAKYFKDRMGQSGKIISYTSDGKPETLDVAQLIITDVLGGNNFEDLDGNGGIANMTQLTEGVNKGDSDEIIKFFQTNKGAIAGNLNDVNFYTIGPNGKTAINFTYKQNVLDGAVKDKLISAETAAALGNSGVTLSIKPGVQLQNVPDIGEADFLSKLISERKTINTPKELEAAGVRGMMVPSVDGSGVWITVDQEVATTKDINGNKVVSKDWVSGSKQFVSFTQRTPHELYNEMFKLGLQNFKNTKSVIKTTEQANSNGNTMTGAEILKNSNPDLYNAIQKQLENK
jgi:hypothetical protein